MVALYRSGRQVEALETYRQARATLVTQLGLEPGPALQQLERGILTHDPALGPQAPSRAPAPARGRRQLGEADFPPLRSLNATNLPAQPSPLVGRERELEEVTALLRDDTRLVTLTGPGGTGKTRLALQAAAELINDFPDGVFWVPLAALRDPALVLPVVEQTLGAAVQLAEHVGEDRMLILLDNLEQVADCAPQFAKVLSRCPGLKLLVTSRVLLRIGGEREYGVPPLRGDDCVTLFRERAANAEPEETVREICRLVDGLPLAVELAAARTRVLAPEKLLARLERRLSLLTGGARDAPVRQRTLRATIEWSHELLAEGARKLFARLAVFAGGFTLEAAEEICDADLDTLESLVESSLARADGERFAMLETIREFAGERLEESGDGDGLRSRHGEYFLRVAERAHAELELEGLESDAWAARLDAEFDNLRAAIGWWAREDVVREVRTVAALSHVWHTRAPNEGRRRFQHAVAKSSGVAPPLRAEVLCESALLEIQAGNLGEARARAEEALSLSRAASDPVGVATSLNWLAGSYGLAGDFVRARLLLEEAREVAGREDLTVWVAWSTFHLGDLAFIEGEFERGRSLSLEALALFRDLNLRFAVAHMLVTLGLAAVRERRPREAVEPLREGLAFGHEHGHRGLCGFALLGFAAVAEAQGECETAARLLGAAGECFRVTGTAFPPVESAVRERMRNELNEGLGRGTVERLVQEGAALELHDAVDLALSLD